MNSKAKLQLYRKEIRRSHIQSALLAKRISLLYGEQANKQEKMEQQVKLSIDVNSITLNDLKIIAKFAQKEEGINTLKMADYQSLLQTFMTTNYTNTEQQFYATYIIANLYFVKGLPPTQSMTQNILRLLDEGDPKIVQNCFEILNNAMTDFPEWKNNLTKKQILIVRLNKLFKCNKPTSKFLQSLLTVIFRILYWSTPEESFKIFKKALCQIILNAELTELQLIKKALHCLSILSAMFPYEVVPYVFQNKVVSRLVYLIPKSLDKKLTYISLQFIKINLAQVNEQLFVLEILPLINELATVNFDLGEISLAFTARKIKLICYTIIKQALEEGFLSPLKFYESLLAPKMFQQFKTTDDEDISIQLLHIFCIVLLNVQNQKLSMQMSLIFQTFKSNNSNNFQILAYLQQIQFLLKSNDD